MTCPTKLFTLIWGNGNDSISAMSISWSGLSISVESGIWVMMQLQSLSISLRSSAELFAAASSVRGNKQVKYARRTRHERNTSISTHRKGNCFSTSKVFTFLLLRNCGLCQSLCLVKVIKLISTLCSRLLFLLLLQWRDFVWVSLCLIAWYLKVLRILQAKARSWI